MVKLHVVPSVADARQPTRLTRALYVAADIAIAAAWLMLAPLLLPVFALIPIIALCGLVGIATWQLVKGPR